jgi:hypothetical protein
MKIVTVNGNEKYYYGNNGNTDVNGDFEQATKQGRITESITHYEVCSLCRITVARKKVRSREVQSGVIEL